jgi:hypothetical protein
MMGGDMAETNPLDRLFKETFATYYDAHFYEIEAEMLAQKWQRVDEVVKVIVAVTASGSAVASWAIWQKPGLQMLWAILSGIAALAAIIHATLGVPGRLKDWIEIRGFFLVLRNDLQILRQRMRAAPNLPIETIQSDYEALRKRFAEGEAKIKSDILLSTRLRVAAQQQLDDRIQRAKNRQQRSDDEL